MEVDPSLSLPLYLKIFYLSCHCALSSRHAVEKLVFEVLILFCSSCCLSATLKNIFEFSVGFKEFI